MPGRSRQSTKTSLEPRSPDAFQDPRVEQRDSPYGGYDNVGRDTGYDDGENYNVRESAWTAGGDFYNIDRRTSEARPDLDAAGRRARVAMSEYHAEPPPYENYNGDIRFDYDEGRWTTDPSTSHAGKGPRGYRRADERIQEEVCEMLAEDPHIDASDVDVEVEDGVVRLVGTVADRRMKYRIEDTIEGLPGILDINNKVRVKKPGQQESGSARAEQISGAEAKTSPRPLH